ncbi:MAG: hypothetical protein QM539_07885, partial [Alphaproteobacteria bacterium]|nr:hypothetical protein [Alphaproteobacteria bacterium]
MKNLTKNTKILYGFISVYFIMYALFKIGIVIFYFKGYSPQEYQLYFVNYFKIPTNWEDFKMYPTGILLSLIAIEYYIQLIIFILGFVIFYKILKTHVNLNLILKSIFITGIIIN